jgi:hypothetical protein
MVLIAFAQEKIVIVENVHMVILLALAMIVMVFVPSVTIQRRDLRVKIAKAFVLSVNIMMGKLQFALMLVDGVNQLKTEIVSFRKAFLSRLTP